MPPTFFVFSASSAWSGCAADIATAAVAATASITFDHREFMPGMLHLR